MLDHSIGQLQFCPSIMSFRRKWVSDTNLSKLLHETLEKKQANKQSKLPDFCKDAILSATIKKISSAMVINKTLSGIGKNEKTLEKDYPNPFLCDPDLPDEELWENKTIGPVMMSIDSFQVENNVLTNKDSNSRTEWRSARPMLRRQSHCASPKRKRHPSSEGTDKDAVSLTNLDAVAPQASPCKKRRENSERDQNEDCSYDNNEFGRFSASSWSEEDIQMNHIPKGQRSQSLPHLTSFLSDEGILVASQADFSSPKSVVNSISELSLHDCWEPTTEGSWCYPKNENGEPDPLELNGFFQELKSVTVHPN